MRTLPAFDADMDTLARKYRSVRLDIEAFVRLLDSDPRKFRGDRVSGFVPHEVYKARVMSRDLQKGKSGGWRVILEHSDDEYVLVHCYSHSGSSQSGRSESALREEIRHRLGS